MLDADAEYWIKSESTGEVVGDIRNGQLYDKESEYPWAKLHDDQVVNGEHNTSVGHIQIEENPSGLSEFVFIRTDEEPERFLVEEKK